MLVPVESEDEKGEHLEPEKEEDVGITFVARKVPDTPKERPKSGKDTSTQERLETSENNPVSLSKHCTNTVS